MRLSIIGLALMGLLVGCKGEATAPATDPADVDPKSLYDIEASVTEGLAPGAPGSVTFAIVPKPGAEVKAETPLTAKVAATGPIDLEEKSLGYADHARLEANGPVFEVPFQAAEAGEGAVDVDMTFFICTAELCMRTQEDLSLKYSIQ